MTRPKRPGFYYAGLPDEPLQGSSTFSVRHKWVHITGSVPLCKLHGSLDPNERVASRFVALTRGTVTWEGTLERFVATPA